MNKPFTLSLFFAVVLAGSSLLLGCGLGDIIVGLTPGDEPPPNCTPGTPGCTPVVQLCADGSAPPCPPPGICADTGKTYTGFGGSLLTVGRVEKVVGVDRGRVKPYSALVSTAMDGGVANTDGGTNIPGDFQRVIGNASPLLTQSATTYDGAPARWYIEPQGTAINIYTTLRVGLQSCTTALTDAKYNAAPTSGTADIECRAWIRKAWSRAPTQAEVDQCVNFALNDTQTELKGSPPTATTTPAARRWAYTCATVLTAAAFTTY